MYLLDDRINGSVNNVNIFQYMLASKVVPTEILFHLLMNEVSKNERSSKWQGTDQLSYIFGNSRSYVDIFCGYLLSLEITSTIAENADTSLPIHNTFNIKFSF